ncbi:MAG TPA: FAD:protein FMN transferase [Planctomycetota bacterium]|nr:FAD:protein FMN transferase [Planctomycetota bacterium]
MSLLLLLIIALQWNVASAAEPPALSRFEAAQPHMGTRFRIVLYAKDEATAMAAVTDAFARIEQLNNIMSDYKSDSELMNAVHKAGGEPLPASADFFEVLMISKQAALKSGGAFDVTLGPVIRLWRRARRQYALPAPEKLAEAKSLVGIDDLLLDEKTRTVKLAREGMVLDLGGIAKGYAADAALAVLKKHGISSALVAAGGDIAVSDAPPGSDGWNVEVSPLGAVQGKSEAQQQQAQTLILENAAVSTSGDAEQFVEIGGVRYSHIVDPATGLGLIGHSRVTVVAKTCTETDWLATALSVITPERGVKLVDETPGAAALMVKKEGEKETRVESKRWKLLKTKP